MAAEKCLCFVLIRDSHFIDAIETLQQIKTKFTAFEKLTVIVDTFRKVNAAGMEAVGKDFCWSMDELFPVFQVCTLCH